MEALTIDMCPLQTCYISFQKKNKNKPILISFLSRDEKAGKKVGFGSENKKTGDGWQLVTTKLTSALK